MVLATGEHGTRVVAHGQPGLRVERTWRPPQADRAPAVGAHEVVVEGAAHAGTPWAERRALLTEHLTLVEARWADLVQDRRLQTLVWVRDHLTGLCPPGAHPHGQLFALPVRAAPLAVAPDQPGLVLARAGSARAAMAPAPSVDFEVEVVPGATPRETAEVLWRSLVALERQLGAPPLSCGWVRAARGLRGVLQVTPWLVGQSALDRVGVGFGTLGPAEAAETLRAALP